MVGDVIMKINLIIMTCTHTQTLESTTRDRSFSYSRNYFYYYGNRKREVAVNWSSGEKTAHCFLSSVTDSSIIPSVSRISRSRFVLFSFSSIATSC